MRASDRDRERAVALLRARCVEGYLSVDTFEYRLGRVLASALARRAARPGRPTWRAGGGRGRAGARSRLHAARGTVRASRRGDDHRRAQPRLRRRHAQPTVSRQHLELRALDGAWLAVDLGSSNGTWLMGRRVGRARVTPGDELVLGDCAVVLEPADG